MKPTVLAVHSKSIPYIRSVVKNLHATLDRLLAGGATLALVNSSLDELALPPGTTVFIIGENLGPFVRSTGCTYVHLNFSVIIPLGADDVMSKDGAALIRKKMALVQQKLPQLDAILDYYPAQTAELRGHDLGVPVHGFLPCPLPATTAPIPLDQRTYDICFVGGLSHRRRHVLQQIAATGLTVSPHRGMDLEKAAHLSRCTLNVHMEASNHLEIPRIVGSLSMGTPVLSEDSFGMDCIGSNGAVISCPIDRIAAEAQALLADSDRLGTLQHRAAEAFRAFEVASADLLRASLHSLRGQGVLQDDLAA